MQIFPRGATELPPQAIAADEVYGFEIRVDVSRHTRARTSLRVEVFASPDGRRWEIAGCGEAENDSAPVDQFGAPRQFWTFGTGFKSPRVERGLLVGWNARWSAPQYKVLITATGGDVEAEVIVEPITQIEQPTQHLPFHRSVHIIQVVSAHDEGGSGATTGNITTTTGNALKACCSYYGDFTSMADSKSNTWLDVGGQLDASTSPYRGRMMYAKNITGGSSHNFTFTHSSGGYSNFVVIESFDEHLTASLDQQVDSDSGGSVTTGTLAQAKEIVFGMNSANGGGGYTAPAGWFELYNVTNGATLGIMAAYKIVNSTAAVTWNPTNTSNGPIAVATFKETATPAFIATKPSGSPSYATTKAWTANTVGHWLMNETGSPTSQGATDISGNAYHLTAVKEGALDYPAMTEGVVGSGRVFDGGASDINALISSTTALTLTGAMSAMCVWRNTGQEHNSGTGDPNIFGVASGGTNSSFGLYYQEYTTPDKITWFDGTATYGFVSSKSFDPADTLTTYRFMVTRGGGSGSALRFYYQALNGDALVKDFDGTVSTAADGGSAVFSIGCSAWSGADYQQGIKQAVYEMRLWDVELSESTVAAYFADPYGEFSAAEEHTLDAAHGSFGLTGQDVTLRAGKRTAADHGAFALTGQTAILRRSRMLVATAASITLTGQAAALRAASRLTADHGAYALTGQDVALAVTGAATIIADRGAYALTGQTATLRATQAVGLAPGAFAILGQEAALNAGIALAMDAGSIVLTGQAATFLRTRTLVMARGTFALSGQAAILFAAAAPVVLPPAVQAKPRRQAAYWPKL